MRLGKTRMVVPVTFFIIALLCLLTMLSVHSGTATEIGKYRESFENAQVELKEVNESLALLERVNVSAIEVLREKVSSLKAELNVTEMDAVKERLEIECNATNALRSEVSKLEQCNKKIFSGVFGTFGLLAGFWSAFLLYTLLSAIMKR